MKNYDMFKVLLLDVLRREQKENKRFNEDKLWKKFNAILEATIKTDKEKEKDARV